jgi:hypothetical protein
MPAAPTPCRPDKEPAHSASEQQTLPKEKAGKIENA